MGVQVPRRTPLYTCDTCHKVIVKDQKGNDPGDHDVAYHVAVAYHFQVPAKIMRVQVCASCGKFWPCPTIQEFGR
jgi:hypothetical protein